MTHNRFSIAVAEELFRDTDGDAMDEWYHTSLFLTETDTQSGERTVIQRLCFNNMNGWVLTPNVRQGFEESAKHGHVDLSLVPILSVSELDVFGKWNHALRSGKQIKDVGATFGANFKESPTALNCRTGVKAVVEALGIPFSQEFVKSQAGVLCTKLDGKIIGVEAPRVLSWDEIRAENADLVESLQL